MILCVSLSLSLSVFQTASLIESVIEMDTAAVSAAVQSLSFGMYDCTGRPWYHPVRNVCVSDFVVVVVVVRNDLSALSSSLSLFL